MRRLSVAFISILGCSESIEGTPEVGGTSDESGADTDTATSDDFGDSTATDSGDSGTLGSGDGDSTSGSSSDPMGETEESDSGTTGSDSGGNGSTSSGSVIWEEKQAYECLDHAASFNGVNILTISMSGDVGGQNETRMLDATVTVQHDYAYRDEIKISLTHKDLTGSVPNVSGVVLDSGTDCPGVVGYYVEFNDSNPPSIPSPDCVPWTSPKQFEPPEDSLKDAVFNRPAYGEFSFRVELTGPFDERVNVTQLCVHVNYEEDVG